MSQSLPSAPIVLDACKKLVQILATSFGPMAHHKLILEGLDDVIYTNDGASIVKSLPMVNPIGKMLSDLSKAQEERAGDGTTGVMLLCCELVMKCIEELNMKQFMPLDVICQSLHTVKQLCKETVKDLKQIESPKIENLLSNKGKDLIFHLANNSLRSKEIRYCMPHFITILQECFSTQQQTNAKFHTIEGGHIRDSFGVRGIFCPVSQSTLSKRYVHSTPLRQKLCQCNRLILIQRKSSEITHAERLFWKNFLQHVGTDCEKVLVLIEGQFPFLQINHSKLFILDKLSNKSMKQVSQVLNLPVLQIGSSFTSIDDDDFYNLSPHELSLVQYAQQSIDHGDINNNETAIFLNITIPNSTLFHFIIRGSNRVILSETKRSLMDAYLVIQNHFQRRSNEDLHNGKAGHELVGGGSHLEFIMWDRIMRHPGLAKGIREVLSDCFLSLPRQILLSNEGSSDRIEQLLMKIKHRYWEASERNELCMVGIDLFPHQCNDSEAETKSNDDESLLVANVLDRWMLEEAFIKETLFDLALESALSILRITNIEVV